MRDVVWRDTDVRNAAAAKSPMPTLDQMHVINERMRSLTFISEAMSCFSRQLSGLHAKCGTEVNVHPKLQYLRPSPGLMPMPSRPRATCFAALCSSVYVRQICSTECQRQRKLKAGILHFMQACKEPTPIHNLLAYLLVNTANS